MNTHSGASTFAKGLKVLDCFESGRSDLTMAEIARLTGFDRATVRRLCMALEESGYLVRNERVFRLSPKVVAIAGGYLSSHTIGKSVQPVLNQFAEELDGEIALAVRQGTRAIYIARSAVSSARLSFGFSVGSTLPLLSTAVGRMLLARCPEHVREQVMLECELYKYTDATDTDLASLGTKIQRAEKQGYAKALNEFELGAAGVAVPIPDVGESQAVLATTLSARQFNLEGEEDRVLDIMRRAAMNLRE